MKLQVRKLQQTDWDFLPSWWEAYGQEVPMRGFLPAAHNINYKDGQIFEIPEDSLGMGGFMVCKGNDPIAAMWLWITNSKTAIPAVVIADKSYRDTDRSDALQLLIDFTTDFAKTLGAKFAYSWAKEGVLLEKYLETGYTKDEAQSYELIAKL